MEERKNLFDAIKGVCDENDCLHVEYKCLHEEYKCLKEEMANGENARINSDSYVRKIASRTLSVTGRN